MKLYIFTYKLSKTKKGVHVENETRNMGVFENNPDAALSRVENITKAIHGERHHSIELQQVINVEHGTIFVL